MVETSRAIGRGAVYVYIESIFSMAFGYLLLLILSHLTSPATIGILSLVLSLSSIFSTIISLGVPTGMQRFLGKAFSDGNLAEVKMYVRSSLLLTSVSILFSALFLFILKATIFAGFDLSYVVLTIVLTSATSLTLLFRSIIISSLQTRILAVTAVGSTTARAVVAIVLVILGAGALGITFGYVIGQTVACLLLAIVAYAHVGTSLKSQLKITKCSERILTAGIASWIPGVVVTVGTQLGTVIVFGTNGSNQAGSYFIALSIFSALSTIMSALLSVAFPALSGMADGRKRLTWRMMKISLLISLPLSSALFFYAEDTMHLMGPGYGQASDSLRILLISLLPLVISSGVNTLAYSYGNYKYVLIIGISSSLPRMVLYFLLVPIYGNDGAALSFTVGSVIGLIVAAIISQRIGFKIFWRTMIIVFLIPMCVAYLLKVVHTEYALAVIATFILSIVAFKMTKVLTRLDVVDSILLLPQKMANPFMFVVTMIEKRFTRDKKPRS